MSRNKELGADRALGLRPEPVALSRPIGFDHGESGQCKDCGTVQVEFHPIFDTPACSQCGGHVSPDNEYRCLISGRPVEAWATDMATRRASRDAGEVEAVAKAISIPLHHASWDALSASEKDLFYMQAEYAIDALARARQNK